MYLSWRAVNTSATLKGVALRSAVSNRHMLQREAARHSVWQKTQDHSEAVSQCMESCATRYSRKPCAHLHQAPLKPAAIYDWDLAMAAEAAAKARRQRRHAPAPREVPPKVRPCMLQQPSIRTSVADCPRACYLTTAVGGI